MAKASAKGTDRARAKFLAVLAKTCNVSEAARASNIPRRTAYNWRDTDAEFRAAWDDAEATAVDDLEGVVYERAMAGHSDRLAEILLKAHRPNKYVEKRLLGSDPENPLPSGFVVNLRKADAEAG